ncbi:MAG: adenylate/guanylate cyclase domain-containing protein [Rhodovibrionaceae bacterium]
MNEASAGHRAAPPPGAAQIAARKAQQAEAWKPSIAIALTVGLSAMMALVAGSVLLIGLMTAGTNTVSLLRQLSDLAIRSVEDRIDQQIAAAVNQATAIAGMVERGDLDPEDEEQVLTALGNAMAVVPQTHGLALIRPERPVIAVGLPKGETAPQRFELEIGDKAEVEQLLSAARQGSLEGWRDIFYVEALQQPGIMVHAPIGEEESFAGVVTSMISIFELSSFLDGLEITSGARAFILYGRDAVLAHPELTSGEPNLRKDRLLPELETFGDPVLAQIWDSPEEIDGRILEGTEIQGHRIVGENSDTVFLYREIFGGSGTPWYVGVYMPASETDGSYNRLVYAAAAAGAIMLISVVLVFLVGRNMAHPIRLLAEASNAVTRLDTAETAPLPRSLFRELDSAARAHNSMTGGLRLFSTYVPRQLVLRLMHLGAEGAKLEQRDVSVMFTDIVGFSRLAGELGPGELAAFLNRQFALQAEGIDAEGGIIDKYIGDSIMAFWGAPDDQEDHAARAMRAAILITDAVAKENAAREAEGLTPVGVRIGLHSGPVVVGNIGAPGRINYTLIGDTVNVAQRLEGLGREIDPDATVILVISADCAARLPEELKATLELESHGPWELRGRAGEVEVFRVRRRGNPPPKN